VKINYKDLIISLGKIKSTALNKTQRETVIKFYEALAMSSHLNVGECWNLTKQQLQQIGSPEISGKLGDKGEKVNH
jgi:hypothetical protein